MYFSVIKTYEFQKQASSNSDSTGDKPPTENSKPIYFTKTTGTKNKCFRISELESQFERVNEEKYYTWSQTCRL